MPWVKQTAKKVLGGATIFGTLGAWKGVTDLALYRGDFTPSAMSKAMGGGAGNGQVGGWVRRGQRVPQ